MLSRQILRRFTTSAIRRSGHDIGGIPGGNLPFKTDNKYKVLIYFTLFFGSAFAIPFLMVRHQLLK